MKNCLDDKPCEGLLAVLQECHWLFCFPKMPGPGPPHALRAIVHLIAALGVMAVIPSLVVRTSMGIAFAYPMLAAQPLALAMLSVPPSPRVKRAMTVRKAFSAQS